MLSLILGAALAARCGPDGCARPAPVIIQQAPVPRFVPRPVYPAPVYQQPTYPVYVAPRFPVCVGGRCGR